jgi:bifunctional non-homologous end joining protein LigD
MPPIHPPLPPARFLPPMKARTTGSVPDGRWSCELKYDGYRAIATLNQGKVELWSRTGNSLTDDYPQITRALKQLDCRNATLDGEIVAVDAQGRSRFQLLQGRDRQERAPTLRYFLFDLLHLNGEPMVNLPLEIRQERLVSLSQRCRGPLRVSPSYPATPSDFLEAVRKQGLEGLIAKRPGSLYETGARSGAWVKCKLVAEQEFVIGGFTPPQSSRIGFGALLLGYFRQKEFLYAGKVGSGFNQASLRSLHSELLKHTRPSCPFVNLPMETRPRFGTGMTRVAMKKVTWLQPNLVAQVRFTEWTADGLLRHPVFVGLRPDKNAREVFREPTSA